MPFEFLLLAIVSLMLWVSVAMSLMSNVAAEVVCRNIVSTWEYLSLCVLSALEAGEVRYDEAREGCDAFREKERERLLSLYSAPLLVFTTSQLFLSHPEPHMSVRAGLAQRVKATSHSNHLVPYLSKCQVGLILCPSPPWRSPLAREVFLSAHVRWQLLCFRVWICVCCFLDESAFSQSDTWRPTPTGQL